MHIALAKLTYHWYVKLERGTGMRILTSVASGWGRTKLSLALVLAIGAAGCGGDEASLCDGVEGTCVEANTAMELQTAVNSIDGCTTIMLGAGTFVFDNQVTIRANCVSLRGAGMMETILDFGEVAAQTNGVDVVGDDFLVEDLTVLDAPKDGIRVEDSDGVTFRRMRATWTNEFDETNGAYGIYPVKSRNVLVEDCVASNASDAGLYVGQSENVIVRRNLVTQNVAGLEIENTQYADVYDNVAEHNTGGIVVFDLPGNPIVGRDVRLRDNIIRNNDAPNFAPGGTVALIPTGTGTFAMASRRVEITGNTYENNGTVDIAIISGLVVDGDPATWGLETSSLVGTWEDLALTPLGEGMIANFRSENILIANNTHSGSGEEADASADLGGFLAVVYDELMQPVDSVVYGQIGESTVDRETIANNSNDNHICVGGNTDGTLGLLDFASQPLSPPDPFNFLPPLSTTDFGPFGCTELNGGAVAEVVIGE